MKSGVRFRFPPSTSGSRSLCASRVPGAEPTFGAPAARTDKRAACVRGARLESSRGGQLAAEVPTKRVRGTAGSRRRSRGPREEREDAEFLWKSTPAGAAGEAARASPWMDVSGARGGGLEFGQEPTFPAALLPHPSSSPGGADRLQQLQQTVTSAAG